MDPPISSPGGRGAGERRRPTTPPPVPSAQWERGAKEEHIHTHMHAHTQHTHTEPPTSWGESSRTPFRPHSPHSGTQDGKVRRFSNSTTEGQRHGKRTDTFRERDKSLHLHRPRPAREPEILLSSPKSHCSFVGREDQGTEGGPG